MTKAAVEKEWLEERSTVLVTLMCFRWVGADVILTYYARRCKYTTFTMHKLECFPKTRPHFSTLYWLLQLVNHRWYSSILLEHALPHLVHN